MLHILIGEQQSPDTGRSRRVYATLDRYRELLRPLLAETHRDCAHYMQCDIWARMFRLAFDELEQSAHLAEHFRRLVRGNVREAMSPAEYDDYRRHVYFYKNAFIRVFSILDKLGSFLNGLFPLRTEQVKQRYSYYTVLRQMRQLHAVPDLTRKLTDLKERYAEEMNRLRDKRNVEIHLVNSELEDDMKAAEGCAGTRTYLEDLEANTADLDKGLDMVAESLTAVFQDLIDRLENGTHPAGPHSRRLRRFRRAGMEL